MERVGLGDDRTVIVNEMTRRIAIVSLLLTFACTSRDSGGSTGEHLVVIAEAALEEASEKNERHELREHLRERGYRVCEEGEWPQRWGEDCNACTCDAWAQVRTCTRAKCRQHSEKRCFPPDHPGPPPDTPECMIPVPIDTCAP